MATWLTVYCTKKLAIPSAEVLQTKVLELRERLPEVVADWDRILVSVESLVGPSCA
ncbi:MAG: hypothetical protein KC431_19100 [Myxococcales bacterium]|nr:hypothetical protein [Myxococcales bacterium]